MSNPLIIIHDREKAAMAAALKGQKTIQIKLETLWGFWAAAAPRLVGSTDQAAALGAVLAEFADIGLVTLPRDAWDRSTVPALPCWVKVPDARRPARPRPWTRFPWRAEMGWAASLPDMSDARFADLVAINNWLIRTDGSDEPIVPMRYRSVELFGNEKHLEGMMKNQAFRDAQLSLEMLRCVRMPAPLSPCHPGR